MKKEFLHILSLIFIVCLSSDMHSIEGQETGKMKKGHAIYSWQVKGNPEFCNFMEKHLARKQKTGQQQNFIIPSVEDSEKAGIQIGPDGRLFINQWKGTVIIRDQHGCSKTTIDLNKGQLSSKSLDESLDEEDIKRKAEKLQPGGNLTAFFSGDSEVNVMYDSIIKFVSKVDKSEHPARFSRIADSTLVTVGLKYGQGKKKKIIELESTGEEIKTFIDFVESNKEGRKKILSELSIIKQAMLVADLHMHYCPKNLGFDHPYTFMKRLLQNKIHASLEKNKLEWLQEINT